MDSSKAFAVLSLLAGLLLLLSPPCAGRDHRLVRHNNVLEVPNGRVAYVRPRDLSFHKSVISGGSCKVEVVTNEPMHQRVGVFTPEVSCIAPV